MKAFSYADNVRYFRMLGYNVNFARTMADDIEAYFRGTLPIDQLTGIAMHAVNNMRLIGARK